jgi:hypothetical protein
VCVEHPKKTHLKMLKKAILKTEEIDRHSHSLTHLARDIVSEKYFLFLFFVMHGKNKNKSK